MRNDFYFPRDFIISDINYNESKLKELTYLFEMTIDCEGAFHFFEYLISSYRTIIKVSIKSQQIPPLDNFKEHNVQDYDF